MTLRYSQLDAQATDSMTDGPTLITQLPGYPEERPETDELDGVLEHLASELEGKQVLEKPRVSKKVEESFRWLVTKAVTYGA